MPKNILPNAQHLPKSAKLILQDKTIFSGFSFGFPTSASGEVVFNTGMMGYPESLTDPSYRGQILVFTYPSLGNYGVPKQKRNKYNILTNFESEKIQVTGVVVQQHSLKYGHSTAERSLAQWLYEHNIPAIYGVDTRALTKKLREKGVMLGKIVIDKDINIENPLERNLVAEVSTKQVERYGKSKYKVILIDCGLKNNILNALLKEELSVVRVPWDYDFLNEEFDGVFISNGPGNPKKCIATIAHIKKAMKKKKPIFGICLGSQLLALAAGANTYKLKYGHRSHNQPCQDITTGKSYITSQNHGYAVDVKNLAHDWEEWFVNINDRTNEGIIHKSGLFKGTQFHIENCPGPKDTEFLLKQFVEDVKKHKHSYLYTEGKTKKEE